jgi:hypothetical protein
MTDANGAKHDQGNGQFAKSGNKQPHDKSTEKAKELTLEDWGTEAEVREIAKPIRSAADREEATKILKDVMNKNKDGLHSADGVTATLSGDSIRKLVSGKSLSKSVSNQAHYQAVANLDKLFSHALEKGKFPLDPNKDNTGLKGRKFLYAPMEFDRKLIPVKFTVKEFANPKDGNRIYSIEAVDAIIGEKNKGAGLLAQNSFQNSDNPAWLPIDLIIANLFAQVNLNIDGKQAKLAPPGVLKILGG